MSSTHIVAYIDWQRTLYNKAVSNLILYFASCILFPFPLLPPSVQSFEHMVLFWFYIWWEISANQIAREPEALCGVIWDKNAWKNGGFTEKHAFIWLFHDNLLCCNTSSLFFIESKTRALHRQTLCVPIQRRDRKNLSERCDTKQNSCARSACL